MAGSTTIGTIDGFGSNALFNSPIGVAVDPNSGCIYVSDNSNNNIRKIVMPAGNLNFEITVAILITYELTGNFALKLW